MERILLVGGIGTLGGAVALRLLSAGRPVRVLTRAPERAAALRERGAEIVTGDLLDVQSLQHACRGVTHVITMANAFIGSGRNSVRTVDEQGNRRLIDAATSEGVRRFVFTSALLGEAYQGNRLFCRQAADRGLPPRQRSAVHNPASDGLHGDLGDG